MKKFKLSKDVYVKTVAIRVNNVEKMANFYKNVLGFVLKLEENNLSIFGSLEKNSRLLILEETRIEEKEVGAFEQSFCFSLLIPTEEEFGSMMRRISAHDYPIKRSVQHGNRRSIFLTDPEGNELEVSVQALTNKWAGEPESFNVQTLVHESNVLYSSLSEKVRFDQIKMPMSNKEEYHYFFEEILGMDTEYDQPDELSLNNGNFLIHLDGSAELADKRIVDEVTLGIDFFVLPLKNEEDMLKLKTHLEENKQEFYVDKKLTILTIYDPGNIEWWFVRN